MDPMVWLLKNRYGSLELSRQVGPNMLRGLVGSVLLHAVVFGAIFALAVWNGMEHGDRTTGPLPPIVLQTPTRPVRPLPPIHRELTRPTLPDVVQHPVPVIDDPDQDIKPDLPVGKWGLPGDKEQGGTGITDTPPIDIPPGGVVGLEDDLPEEGIFVPREFEPVPLTVNVRPQYPEMALASEIDGRVWVSLLIDKHGDVAKWRVASVKPAGLGFEQAVEQVIPRWKFTPALQQGQPVAVWVSIPIVFSIRK